MTKLEWNCFYENKKKKEINNKLFIKIKSNIELYINLTDLYLIFLYYTNTIFFKDFYY